MQFYAAVTPVRALSLFYQQLFFFLQDCATISIAMQSYASVVQLLPPVLLPPFRSQPACSLLVAMRIPPDASTMRLCAPTPASNLQFAAPLVFFLVLTAGELPWSFWSKTRLFYAPRHF